MLTVKSGDTIIESGQNSDTFYIIASGTVSAIAGGKEHELKKGDIVGIFDLTSPTHICSYIATSACELIPYPFMDTNGLINMLNKQEDLRKLLMSSLNRNICGIIASYSEGYNTCNDLYQYILGIQAKYQAICQILHLNAKSLPFSDDLLSFTMENELPFWMNDYYLNSWKIHNDSKSPLTSNYVYGYLDKSGQDICHILELDDQMHEASLNFGNYLLNEDYLDYYDLFTDLYFRAKTNGDHLGEIQTVINDITQKLSELPFVSKELLQMRTNMFKERAEASPVATAESADDAVIMAELTNSFTKIAEFGDVLPTTVAEMKKALDAFKQFPDRSSTDKEVDLARRQITKLFYMIYEDVLQAALKTEDIPTVVKMFLNFGYLDAELCGMDNAREVYELATTFHGNREQGVYTVLEWFKAIYEGRKQPSRSEFDQDYQQYVRSLSKEGKITKDGEMAMMEDANEKVLYELRNMFPSVNKITFGRIFTFCPILLEENLLRSPKASITDSSSIIETINKLNKIDYSVFYHEYLFEDTKVNVKETVRMDIRPDVILMPNVGSKGIMWQEIEGMNRKTPARMIVSAFYIENLDKAFTRMFAEFRWEMCKREMGARWNDVTNHSLTSDFCDYAQFFAKNRDLSYDTKEKIKETLKKCKNSYKEFFIHEYMIYMAFEATGSCRLNKVSRSILFKYCPMGSENREKVGANTIFEECLSKHHISTGQQLHRLDQIEAKYRQAGKDMPAELASQRALLER